MQYGFPENDDLNTESTDTNILVTDLATQDLTNKRINRPILIDDLDVNNRIVTLELDNITAAEQLDSQTQMLLCCLLKTSQQMKLPLVVLFQVKH